MLITGTEGYLPVQKKSTARLAGGTNAHRARALGGAL